MVSDESKWQESRLSTKGKGVKLRSLPVLIVLFIIPFTNTSNIRSTTFRPIFKIFYWLLVADFIILGWVGQKPVKVTFVIIGQIATLFYFLFF